MHVRDHLSLLFQLAWLHLIFFKICEASSKYITYTHFLFLKNVRRLLSIFAIFKKCAAAFLSLRNISGKNVLKKAYLCTFAEIILIKKIILKEFRCCEK